MFNFTKDVSLQQLNAHIRSAAEGICEKVSEHLHTHQYTVGTPEKSMILPGSHFQMTGNHPRSSV